MAKGFKGTGARVKKTGKSFAVVHGTTGAVLSRHGTEGAARKAAAATRARNRGSFTRSRKNRKRHD
jgi:hypothetical protein